MCSGCSPGTWGINCKENCSSNCANTQCNSTDGRCTKGCVSGFIGPYCTTPCGESRYGPNCESLCSSNCNKTQCNSINGMCFSCISGYTGDFCEQNCTTSRYGPNCENNCSSNCFNTQCNSATGVCDSCYSGYIGDLCNETCTKGNWGKACSNNCSKNCNNTDCDPTNGTCTYGCLSGYYEPTCVDKCNSTFYGPNCVMNCSSNCTDMICDAINGFCLSCIPGSQGNFCELSCNETFYGQDCGLKCNSTCVSCNSVNGICTKCVVGKTGQYCGEDCPDGTYGPNCTNKCSPNCSSSQCDPVTGHCTRCPPGYKGEYCGAKCESNKYGANCNSTCSTKCMGESCNHINGTCLYGCAAGYQGSLCDQECDNETYGVSCLNNCSSLCLQNGTQPWCDFRNGECLFGCHGNYLNNKSECLAKPQSNTGNDVPSAAIAVPLVLIVLLAACLVGAIVYWRRGNCKLGKKNKQSVLDSNSLDDFETGTELPYTIDTTLDVSNLYFFMQTHNREHFVEEFKRIPAPKKVSTKVADSEGNRIKNRYRNISAYDHSRVHLEINTNKNEGDYINASYIEGYCKHDKYIASQGPCESMLNDFIRMLWEQKIDKVVMLTNLIEEGKVKCLKYWPDEGKEKFGDIKVKLAATHVFADYTIRKLELSKRNQPTHPLTHFHFTSWPDKGVPATPWSLVDFEQRVAMEESTRPMVVHCSAGVGRTGTFIALRNVMREAEDTGVVNFFRTVSKLRQDRMMMIQTAEQYEFLHKAAQVAIVCMGTTVTSRDIESRISWLQESQVGGGSHMESEFKSVSAVCDYLCTAKPRETDDGSEMNVYQNGGVCVDAELNRDPTVLPDSYYQIRLSRETTLMRDYINAVTVPGFTRADGQILTQLPMPATVVDFWRLVMQYNVALVVAFEMDMRGQDKTIGQYLPESSTQPLSCGLYEVSTGPIRKEDHCEIQNVSVKSTQKNMLPQTANEQSLKHISFKTLNLDPDSWLNVMMKTRASNTQGRTLFMCRNGVTYSGLACVLNLLLDRLDHDQSLTVPLVVGAVKCIRPQVISTLDQYHCLYQVLQKYNDALSQYGNFNFAQTSLKQQTLQPTFNDAIYANT
ncbi:receptor-type tyrosine-protein phosphatase alpha-like [Physella acuta]|uniref:receptor-type tyrosine-protein phosphatase alpha-like n=1 Tax=Physella acuta TaxID=109671 RepID=UPI0027DC6D5E|nr:receptor-type tyrosine-protein phosphatase alpha-like [Physella acuta]